jgi:hypothetical protein
VGRTGKDLALAFASSALLRGDDAVAGVVVVQPVGFGAEAALAVPSGPGGRERLKSQRWAVATGSRADAVVRVRSSTIALSATVRLGLEGGVASTRPLWAALVSPGARAAGRDLSLVSVFSIWRIRSRVRPNN